jgi:ankyrin repeat protein
MTTKLPILQIIQRFDNKNKNNLFDYANIDFVDECGNHGFIYLVRNQYLDLIEHHLLKTPDLINRENNYGDTALFIAVVHENIELITLLLNYGANIEHLNKTHHTPIFNAIHCKDPEVLELLINRGANTKIKDTNNITPKDIAMKYHYKDMLEILNKIV